MDDDFIWQLKTEFQNNYFIFNSEKELKKHISYNCSPEIDFSKYIIIIGSKGFVSGASLMSEIVEENNHELIYMLTFSASYTMVASDVKYHIVIPLLYN